MYISLLFSQKFFMHTKLIFPLVNKLLAYFLFIIFNNKLHVKRILKQLRAAQTPA